MTVPFVMGEMCVEDGATAMHEFEHFQERVE